MNGQRNQSGNITTCASLGDCMDYKTNHARTTTTLLLIILGALIILISGLIIISFVLNKRLRGRPANIMICSQACADMFTAMVFIPLNLVHKETTKTLSQFLGCYMLYLSLLNLLLINVDRYLALNRPFLHRKLITIRNTHKLLVIAWLAPIVVILVPLFWWFDNLLTKIKATRIYICTIWSLMLVLVIVMTVLYILATKGARHTIRIRRASVCSISKIKAASLAQKELRVVHLFGSLLFFFLLAYLPILYINFCVIIGAHKYAPRELEKVSLYLLICNSVLNPAICIILKKDYLYAIRRRFLHIPTPRIGSSSSPNTSSIASYGSEPSLKRKISSGKSRSPEAGSNGDVIIHSSYDRQKSNDRRLSRELLVKRGSDRRTLTDDLGLQSEYPRTSHEQTGWCSNQSSIRSETKGISNNLECNQRREDDLDMVFRNGKTPNHSSQLSEDHSPLYQIELLEKNNLVAREEYLISCI